MRVIGIQLADKCIHLLLFFLLTELLSIVQLNYFLSFDTGPPREHNPIRCLLDKGLLMLEIPCHCFHVRNISCADLAFDFREETFFYWR
ncbi:hypothetical protein ABH19_01615 [Leptospirillum sp. Group II 'CF-1']|nr:hypothetical protein ABH19_01615 [Leptospirillum sp. Group II 'CF-1']